MSAPLEPFITSARTKICRVCPEPCAERDTLNRAEGCTECPRRIWHAIDCTGDTAADSMRGLGDAVAVVAQPIARMIDSVLGTNVQGCGGCKARQAALNKALPFGVTYTGDIKRRES